MIKKLAAVALMLGIVSSYSVYAQTQEDADETMPEEEFLEPWQKQPKVPNGWQEIHRAEAPLTTKSGKDVFVLAMDKQNLMLFWFRKGKVFWEMLVLASDPLEGYRKAKVDPKLLKVAVKNSRVIFGVEEMEAFAAYKWDGNQQTFIGYEIGGAE